MNVKFNCDKCHHIAFAPADTEPPCRENLADACEMEQVEEFQAKPVKKSTKKVPSDK
jgi:hypothetical protein